MPRSNRIRPTASMRRWSRSGISTIGSPDRFGVSTSSRSRAVEHPRGEREQRGAECVAALLVDIEPGQHGRERGDGRRTGVEVGRRRDLEQLLDLGRAGDEREQRRVRLGEPADEHDVVVGLACVADDAVAAHAVGAQLVGDARRSRRSRARRRRRASRRAAARPRRTRPGPARCRSCCSRRPCRSAAAVAVLAQELRRGARGPRSGRVNRGSARRAPPCSRRRSSCAPACPGTSCPRRPAAGSPPCGCG